MASSSRSSNNVGETRSQSCRRAFYIEVNAKVQNSQLHINWSYSQHVHKNNTIEHSAFDFNQTLNELLKIDEALAVDKTQETLFDLADFESDELDAIEKALSGA
jgi:microcystin synthetase protein McyA